jgi:UDP-N-acetylglucosamine 2-epimerase
MLAQVLDLFGVVPDADLALMQPNQSLASLTARTVEGVDRYLADRAPDMVLVQGDTTTSFCASLAAFYRRIPLGHVEAGLRTWDKHSPFPEEINRVLTSRIADLHFAPTQRARGNLLQEGIDAGSITVTGNTVIDALQIAVDRVRRQPPIVPGLPPWLLGDASSSRMVLITGHRRENFGAGFGSICAAIARLADTFSDVVFVYPVHLNPSVREPVFQSLGGRPNVYLIDPVEYVPFVALMERSTLILTDSGGVQEEAPSLGKPVLVMRNTTERPEAVDAGTVRLVGTDADRIVGWVSDLLLNQATYDAMARAINPYGDGFACERIAQAIAAYW